MAETKFILYGLCEMAINLKSFPTFSFSPFLLIASFLRSAFIMIDSYHYSLLLQLAVRSTVRISPNYRVILNCDIHNISRPRLSRIKLI